VARPLRAIAPTASPLPAARSALVLARVCTSAPLDWIELKAEGSARPLPHDRATSQHESLHWSDCNRALRRRARPVRICGTSPMSDSASHTGRSINASSDASAGGTSSWANPLVIADAEPSSHLRGSKHSVPCRARGAFDGVRTYGVRGTSTEAMGAVPCERRGQRPPVSSCGRATREPADSRFVFECSSSQRAPTRRAVARPDR
jgi:hypothetical protein